jgi:hypothetical protein
MESFRNSILHLSYLTNQLRALKIKSKVYVKE